MVFKTTTTKNTGKKNKITKPQRNSVTGGNLRAACSFLYQEMGWGQWEEEEVGLERKEPFLAHLEDWPAVAGVGKPAEPGGSGKQS